MLLLGFVATVAAAPPRNTSTLLSSLSASAPQLDPKVLALALDARDCATRRGLLGTGVQRLAVIDYTRPSFETRLWVFDLNHPGLLFAELVATVAGPATTWPAVFPTSTAVTNRAWDCSRTAESYTGGNGYSLRMDGLEPGFNDHARDRSIVMHGAWYVDSGLASKQGRLGRSYGCPAVRPTIARPLIDSLKDGQLLFAYYPDADWLAHSHVLRCAQAAEERR